MGYGLTIFLCTSEKKGQFSGIYTIRGQKKYLPSEVSSDDHEHLPTDNVCQALAQEAKANHAARAQKSTGSNAEKSRAAGCHPQV